MSSINENNEQSNTRQKPVKKKRVKLESVTVRNLMAYSILRKSASVAIVSILCTVISVMAAIKIFSSTPPPRYIQLTEDAKLFPIIPTTAPNADSAEIINFSIDSVKWLNTYDYISWKDQFSKNSDRFTAKGWRNYMDELYSTNTLVLVAEKRMVVSAMPTAKAYIEQEGKENGTGSYIWVVKVPFEILYTPADSSAQKISQAGEITLYVKRVPLEVSTRGYAIEIYSFDTTSTP